MYPDNEKPKYPTPLVGILITACVALVILVLSIGAAYTAVKSARFSAGKASIGQIEAVMLLSEIEAEKKGLGPPPDTYQNLIKSYDDGASTFEPTPYEKYILTSMLDHFGPSRDFDFAVTRYKDGAGIQTQVYFFPYIGQTDVKRDRYYLLNGSAVSEHNTQ